MHSIYIVPFGTFHNCCELLRVLQQRAGVCKARERGVTRTHLTRGELLLVEVGVFETDFFFMIHS